MYYTISNSLYYLVFEKIYFQITHTKNTIDETVTTPNAFAHSSSCTPARPHRSNIPWTRRRPTYSTSPWYYTVSAPDCTTHTEPNSRTRRSTSTARSWCGHQTCAWSIGPRYWDARRAAAPYAGTAWGDSARRSIDVCSGIPYIHPFNSMCDCGESSTCMPWVKA